MYTKRGPPTPPYSTLHYAEMCLALHERCCVVCVACAPAYHCRKRDKRGFALAAATYIWPYAVGENVVRDLLACGGGPPVEDASPAQRPAHTTLMHEVPSAQASGSTCTSAFLLLQDSSLQQCSTPRSTLALAHFATAYRQRRAGGTRGPHATYGAAAGFVQRGPPTRIHHVGHTT